MKMVLFSEEIKCIKLGFAIKLKTINSNVILFTILLFSTFNISLAQNVGIGTQSPDSSAALDISADGLGVLIPRMDSITRQNISSPAVGLMVYDSSFHEFWYYSNAGWMAVDGSTLGAYFCLDQDGDAFGNPVQPVWVPNGVVPPPSFVVDCTDLDDADSTIYIGAPCDVLNPNTAAYIDSNGVCIDTLIDPLSLLCEPDSCGLWNVEINGDCYYGSCWTTGVATVYGSGSGGNCGWDDEDLMLSPFNGKVAAVGSDLWDLGLGCGDVYDVLCTFDSNTQNCVGSCTGNIVRVMVVDQCPECTNTQLDLSSEAWAELITASGCVADIEFRRVGHEYGVNIQVDVKSGSSDYYLEFYPKFSNKTIQSIEVSSNESSMFYQVEHTENQGFWKIDANTGISLPIQFPLSFKFTSNDGDVILAEDVLTSSQSIGNVDSGVNFTF